MRRDGGDRRGGSWRPGWILPVVLLGAGCVGGGDDPPPPANGASGVPAVASADAPGEVPGSTSASPLAEAFAVEGAVGTLLIRRLGDGREWVHDPSRAGTPLLPASTFKIANAAIALETGVVTGADELFPWDGRQRELEAWNRDLTLGEAMATSAVPVYQEVARRVGSERMAEWLQRLDYGNGDIGGGLERFWLDGALRISAREQVDFLERLLTGDLPLSQRTLDELTTMLRLDGGDGWALYGKTGWASAVDLGWWVGWTVQGEERYGFALNMDMSLMEDAPKRISIARRALVEVGALPREAGGG